MSKFKVGDRVRVLNGSGIKNYTANWCEDMNKYVGKEYEIEQVFDPYEKNKVAYILKDCRWYKFDERGLVLVPKFKVGDKVIANANANAPYTITKEGWIGTVTEVCGDMIYAYGPHCIYERGFYVKAKCFDLYENSATQKIVITSDGKTTTAVLYDGKKRIKDAKAECAPSDKFDFGTGAALAVERLMGNSEATLPEEKSEFLTARIYVIHAGDASDFEAGKIYDIKDGRFSGTPYPYNGNIKDLDDLKYYLSSSSEQDELKHSYGLRHLCHDGVKYQVLEPLE